MAPGASARPLAVGRNTLILLASNFSSAAFALVISILIARNAGDAALGIYSLALAWSLTLAQFADLGMNTLLTRDLAHAPEQTAAYVRASLLSKTALSALLTLGLVLAAPALAQGDSAARALQLGAGLIALNAWYGTFTAVFRASGRMVPILILNLGGVAVQTLLTWQLVARAFPIETLVALAVLIQALQLAAAWGIYARVTRTRHEKTQIDFAYVWRLTRAGIPFAIAGILAGVEMRANIFLLGALAGERAVGWYSAASRLNEGIRLAPNAFFGAVLPALALLQSTDGPLRLQTFFRRREVALILFGGAAALFLSAFAQWLILFLYGDSFAPAVPALIILGWGLIPALWIGLLTLFLYARHQEQLVNWFLALGLLLHAGLAVPFIGQWGTPGAAAAALSSDIVVCLLMRRRVAQFLREP